MKEHQESTIMAPLNEVHVEVLIIGAGVSGIGAAIRLRQAGIDDFVVLEKAGDVGGAWRENTYPGCACDVPSALYSYSFAPNPDWTRAFAGQAEIWSYLHQVAIEHGVTPRIRFRSEVLSATWNEAERVWRVESTRGIYTARALVAAAGPLHKPSVPDLAGLTTFAGKMFHSAEWDHGYELAGKRVAVIGTGASAVQFVPEIQPRVAKLHLFQRTPSWVLPKPDHAIPAIEGAVFRHFPQTQRAVREAQSAVMEVLAFGFRHPRAMGVLQQLARMHLRAQVPDPRLRRALTPRFVLGCKRILLSNTYYRALSRSNVAVHPTAVTSVKPGEVIGADGTVAAVDTIIFGTGFHVTDPPIAACIVGASGQRLSDRWKGSPRGYLGTTVVGYPNLFFMLGPNLGTGHSSAFSIIEAQLDQIVAAISTMRRERWTRLEVRADVEAAFNDEVQAMLSRTVYNVGGCTSYYLDASGRNSTIWPWSTGRLVRRVGKFEARAYSAL
jgi:cation diffusion facilitator CzcD-associated flavoprotein CzcO